MSEHIRENDLQNYGAGKLPPREFLRVQAHLEICDECRRRLDEMFPNIAEREEALLLEDLQKEVLNDFHLDYDEHLKPYIYETIDAVDKEIVESHVEVCAGCREDLRDLLQFHEELEREKEIRELSKARWWSPIADWFSAPNRKTVWFVFASILLFVGASLVWFFLARPANEIAQSSSISGSLNANQTASNVNQTVIEVGNQNINAPKTNQTITPELPEKEIEMAALVLPKFLGDLRANETETLRGDGDLPPQKIVVVAPNGAVIRTSSPVLTWRNVPNVENYEVAVFDENDNRVAKIENFKGNSWRIANLPKGKIYTWQVSAELISADGNRTNYLGQGKFYIVSERDENEINKARNALERGRAFAEAGLLREAAEEFRKYLKENLNSENAKKFLRQVEQAQR